MEKSEIREAIMEKFKKMGAKPKQSLDVQWYSSFLNGMNAEDKQLAQEAIKELEEEGLIKKQAMLSAETIVLTEKGYENL